MLVPKRWDAATTARGADRRAPDHRRVSARSASRPTSWRRRYASWLRTVAGSRATCSWPSASPSPARPRLRRSSTRSWRSAYERTLAAPRRCARAPRGIDRRLDARLGSGRRRCSCWPRLARARPAHGRRPTQTPTPNPTDTAISSSGLRVGRHGGRQGRAAAPGCRSEPARRSRLRKSGQRGRSYPAPPGRVGSTCWWSVARQSPTGMSTGRSRTTLSRVVARRLAGCAKRERMARPLWRRSSPRVPIRQRRSLAISSSAWV